MATNRELREEAEALADQVGVSVDTSGLGRKKLEDLIGELKARLAPPPDDVVAVSDLAEPEPPSPPKAPEPPAVSGPPRYVVGPRISFCCGPRGLLRPGNDVHPEDFDSPERFYMLVAEGKIRKV